MAKLGLHNDGVKYRDRSRFWRLLFAALLASGVALLLASCGNSLVDVIQISPSSQSIAAGQTLQFTATGVYGHGSHPSSTQDVTDLVAWTSSSPSVATINATGLATGVSAGSTTITARMNGFGGVITTTATLTVTGGSGGGSTNSTITSLSIIPGSQSVAKPGQTAQFIAIGTTSGGATVNLSGQVVWTSSSTQIATVGASTGLATAVGQGTSAITALYTDNGITLTATATLTVVAGTTEQYTAVSIIPNAQSVSASGQTGQFIALATSGVTGLEEDVTASPQIKWSSSIPTIATISSSGLVTGKSVGTSAITAELTNPDGSLVTASASVSVTLTAPPEPLLSLNIIPSSITVGNLQDSANFLAIGTYSTAPYVRDLTNSVTWLSSSPNVFPVINGNSSSANSGVPAGTVTAYGAGTATIIAEATDPTTNSIQTATASFTCPEPTNPVQPGQCYPGSQAAALLATVTIYNEGLNTTNWEVTAPSATGTPNVIHCGPGWALNGGTGGSVCVATYPIGTTVTLTAPATGAQFGGWSSSCTTISPNPSTAAGPNTCTFTITAGTITTPANSNISVGAIFNN